MQKYICSHCDDLECETGICPVCGGKTTPVKSMIYWCKKCNAPSYKDSCDKCGSPCDVIAADLRPVFPEERLLLEILMDCPMKYKDSSVWASGGGYYIIDGERHHFSYTDLSKMDSNHVIQKLKEYKEENQPYCDGFYDFEWVRNFIEINRLSFCTKEYEALEFIRKQTEGVALESMFVSFSGGKDSTVTSSLVMDALTREDIVHIYGDTTLEYPSTGDYIKEFRKVHPGTPMLVAKNRDQDFSDLCRKIGPPSRVMRWCCTVFKTGAINHKIETMFKGEKSIVTFHGIRRFESASRSKYERVSVSPKITKQRVCQPILDWNNFDVWLYIVTKGIPFNRAYREGFSRVGCWCCPNNSDWAGYLSKVYMHEEEEAFRNLLYDFAKDVGKEDWKDYIDNGNWKARQGGNGLDMSKNAIVEFKPCAMEENAFNFELSRPITEHLYNLFVPFGIIDYNLGNARLGEVFILDKKTHAPLLKLSGKIGQNHLKVTIINFTGPFRNKNKVEPMVKAQITKFQTCIGCSACASVCKHAAITVENLKVGEVSTESIHYYINPDKCVGCLDCILHFDSGCYMKKVLRTKMED